MKNLSSLLFYVVGRMPILIVMGDCIVFKAVTSMIKGVQNNQRRAGSTYGIGYVLILLALCFCLFIRKMMNGSNEDRGKNSVIISI